MTIYQESVSRFEMVTCPHGLRCGKKNYNAPDHRKEDKDTRVEYATKNAKKVLNINEKIDL